MKLEKLLTLVQFVDQFSEGSKDSYLDCFAAILRYNEFLKQPLTKEMKAIFKDVEYCNGLIKYPLDVNFGGAMELRDNYLHDLAEATKGELELKNVIL